VRYASARAGAAISVPITTACFWLLSPFLLRLEHSSLSAASIFAAVGIFFPASVTLLNFASARRLGPSIASALGTSTAIFSAILAITLLHERPSLAMLLGTLIIVAGVSLITFRKPPEGVPARAAWLLMPIAAALIRALAQTATKYGLALWPSPFAATLLSYTVSASLLFASRPGNAATATLEPGRAVFWFAWAGLCNGGAVLAIYAAMSFGPLTLVAPLATPAPIFAVVISAIWLREEHLDARLLLGVAATVVGAVLVVLR
jgi:drug/metabolite transporter (DMT)-like permease